MLPNNCFVYTKEDVLSLQQSKLFGYAWTDDALIFNSDGLNLYLENNKELPTEGRFCGIFLQNKEILIYSDFTAQETLYLFQQDNDWAISNSFMLLAQMVSKKHKLTFYPPASACFHLKNGIHIGEQLISHKTMIEEIRVVPITNKLSIDRITGNIQVIQANYQDILYQNKVIYEDLIVDTLERGAGAIQALIDLEIPLNLSLSGGYDSRVVLGMATKTNNYQEHLAVSSHEFKEDDFKSAKLLTEYFNLPLNIKEIATTRNYLSSSDMIRMYMLSCGGTYLPFYPVSDFMLREEVEIKLTGDQPVGRSHFEGNVLFNGTMKKVSSDILNYMHNRKYGQEIYADFLSVFNDLDLDINSSNAQLAYYQSIRSRFHCGRNWYKSLGKTFLFTPLVQKNILLIDSFANQNAYPNKMFVDMFSALGKWALDIPFETPNRNFNQYLLDESPFKGGIKIAPRSTRIYGKPNSNQEYEKNPFSMLSLDIVFNGSQESIKDNLSRIFYQSKYARECDVFNQNDFVLCNQEIRENGKLSHHYRKTLHVISTDIVLSIVANSGKGV